MSEWQAKHRQDSSNDGLPDHERSGESLFTRLNPELARRLQRLRVNLQRLEARGTSNEGGE